MATDLEIPDSASGKTAAPSGVADLAARVAHELNNPLDAVLRFVTLAQRKAKTGNYEDLDRHLADAQFGLHRMAEILRDLMDIGRDTQEILARTQRYSLPELIAAAQRTLAAQAEQRKIRMLFHNHVPATPAVHFDVRLSQIFVNLLKNAIEAAPENSSIDITAEPAPAIERHLRITITDSGPGIDPQIRSKLFTPFATTKNQSAGHGLGLAISRELALSLNASLTLESRTDHAGCIATLILPIH